MPLCAQEQLPARWGDQGDGTFLNPILRADYSDPDPLRVGDDYYLVASTFESYPGVTILHSRDLINWEETVPMKTSSLRTASTVSVTDA